MKTMTDAIEFKNFGFHTLFVTSLSACDETLMEIETITHVVAR